MKMITELPESWSLVSFGDILDIQGGSQPPKSAFKSEPSDGYIRLLQIRDFGKKPVPTYVPEDSVTKLCEKDDIFVARYGASLGRILTGMEGAYNVALAKVIYSKNLFEKKYLYYLLKTPIFQTPIMMISRSAQNGFNKGDLYPIQIPVAPKKQQLAIANKIEELFSHIDAGVEGLKQAKYKLQQYRQSVLKDAVTGKLTEKWRKQNADKLEPASELLERILEERCENWEAEQLKIFEVKGKTPKDDKWKDKYKEPMTFGNDEQAFDIPTAWEWCYFEAIGQVTGGLTKNSKRNNLEKKLPYLRVANVYANELRLDEIKEIGISDSELDRVLLKDKDLLIVEGNGSPDQIGRLAVWDDSIQPCVHQNHLIKVRLVEKLLCDFIVFWLTSLKGREQIKAVASSTSGLYTLSISKISGLPVPLPSLKEAIEISNILSEKLSATDRAEEELIKKIEHSEQLKSSILADAFSGKLVENIETDETAEQLLEKIQTEKLLLEEKAKLAKNKPTARTKKMDKQPIIDVLKKAAGAEKKDKALTVDELFEQAGFQNDVSPEGIEAFYQELKIVTENENVTVTPVMLKEQKQGDKFEYKEVKENEAG
ncbi:restriction endonuclease subunit S [Cognaticolwellia mytili]|uniref:restriction endonuclease subunit S n=1 Tax=Cognaticolwellia mytili TaxID=1888913 RepID=UPI000A16CC71|nr:restriction endonuclease subunit S [Cognaticolwellia mytili]